MASMNTSGFMDSVWCGIEIYFSSKSIITLSSTPFDLSPVTASS